MAKSNPQKRYHPALVTLHWLIMLLVIGTLLTLGEGEAGEGGRTGQVIQGGEVGEAGEASQGLPAVEAGEGGALAGGEAGASSSTNMHMLIGIAVLVLMAIRLLVRWGTQRPEWATTGNEFLNKLGEWTHYALYVFTFAITVTGVALASQTNRLGGLFGGATAGGPAMEGESVGFGLGAFHGLSWAIFALLIFLHVAGALYHQFIIKDNLFSRMWYGSQSK